MIPDIRKQYNAQFTQEKYQAYINELNNVYPGNLDFRIAETPVFVPKKFTNKVLSACERIIDVISKPEYHKQSDKAIPAHLRVPNEDSHPDCIAFDFGVCKNDKGELEPQLIEMQGFPSLFAWQVILPEIHHKHFWWPDNYSVYLNGFNRESYIELLHNIIIADCDPENVILLEIFPHQQKTRVDFYATESLLGIKTVCLTELIEEGKNLYYLNNGKKTLIQRVYNRVIFDDLFQQPKEVQEKGKIFQKDLNVNWVPHPNWFYRLSKFTLPFIKHPYVPETHFLNDVQLPPDLDNYVVKPLFSFAGQGVIIDVTKEEKGKIFQKDLNVNWVPHPNWFYRLSKFTLPFIKHPYVPETHFLNQVQLPSDLENYVVKPLFSFAGQGVIIDVTKEEIEKIKDPENWIIQRKVVYANAIETPDEPAKAEMRIFYFWEHGADRPVAANNLSRLSKGKMIGVRYNKDKDWVGGSFCLFEQ